MAYDDPAGIIAMAVILEILIVAAVVLRFLSRRKMDAGYWADDWLIVAALICATGLTANEIYGAVVKALGVPLNTNFRDPQADAARLVAMKRVQFVFWLVGDFGIPFTKLSIIFLFRRVFGRHETFKIISTVWIVTTALWGTAFILATVLERGSHRKIGINGSSTEFRKYCKSSAASGKGMVISDAITDLITLLLPLPWVLKLCVSLQRKLCLLGIFLIGAVSVAASATKAAIYITGTTGIYKIDGGILMTELSVWNYVEVTIGILAGCAVTFGPLIKDTKLSRAGLTRRLGLSISSSSLSSSDYYEKTRDSQSSCATDSSTGAADHGRFDAADRSLSDLESGDLGAAAGTHDGHPDRSRTTTPVRDHTRGDEADLGAPLDVVSYHQRSTVPP